MVEVSLSRVTVRGEEITLVSAYVLRNDNTRLTPSAFRKKVAGLNPRAVSTESPPLPITEFRMLLTPELARPLDTELARALLPDEAVVLVSDPGVVVAVPPPGNVVVRSEERRVGKECRSRW